MSKLALCLPRHFAPPSVLQALQERSCRFIKNDNDITQVFKMAGPFSVLKERPACETDEDFLQLLPYCRVVDKTLERVFFYQRGAGGGEARLHGDWSVGLGGHVEELPEYESKRGVYELFANTLSREIHEEIGLKGLTELDFDVLGLIVDGSNSVGRVHLGIAYELNLHRSLDELEFEKGVITNGTWKTPSIARMAGLYGKLENWSKVFMAYAPSNYYEATQI